MSQQNNARVSTASRTSSVELRTPAAIAAIAKRFAPVVFQTDDTPVPPSNADYFARMNMPSNIELDSGDYATIDVQFDTRFIMNYILYHATNRAPEMNFKGHPYATPLSYAGYCLTLLYTFMLAVDVTTRPEKSWHAARFMSDAERKDLYDVLLSSRVPTWFVDLLIEFAPVFDPRRNNILMVPTLAGYIHNIDFGRTFPPSIFYSAHHLLASTRTNLDPDNVIDSLMGTPLINHGTNAYTVSNYLGTWYDAGHHPNFVNQDYMSFFNPLVGRFLTQRPTFARLPFSPEDLADNGIGNIYTTFLLASDENISLANTLYTAMSTFVLSDEPNAPQLGSVLSSLSGSLLLSHSIEPITLPTWTKATYVSDIDPSLVSDSKFVSDHNLFSRTPKYEKSTLFPNDGKTITSLYYLVTKKKHDANDNPTSHLSFKGKDSVTPYVLYFQPYDVSPSSLGLTIAAGLKIELAEISGFTVPVEHPESSLLDNNSQYLQSAIRANLIAPVNDRSTAAENSSLNLARSGLDSTLQGITASFISTCKSVLPFFDNEGNNLGDSTDLSKFGLTPELHHVSPFAGFNVKAGTNGQLLSTEKSIHLWSSYRVVHTKKNPAARDISFIASFRPIYGTNVTLSRSKNPSLIIPH
ncbi:putative capsid protein [Fusarium poae virus 1]|uniref:Putative capsid protein n=1 Tax=Fusarium poae virus 1 TaxID=75747 RepID=Q9YYT5_9VIRU|nr:putative capsid protein [Fusarium poae virus 1]AAC98725.2 putative capsid protein [Fusarium poae virus 1]